MKTFFYKSLDSTNKEARRILDASKEAENFWVDCWEQAEGKGQGVNTWSSESGKNITTTLRFQPVNLKAADQFSLSMAVSLSLKGFLELFTEGVSVKWPNDLYIKDHKIGGVLIENELLGSVVSNSLIGIGLNINQRFFSSELPNPTSLWLINGLEYSIEELYLILKEHMMSNLDHYLSKSPKQLTELYLSVLYRYKKFCPYRNLDQKWFEARIVGIGEFGELLLELKTGEIKSFAFKEVEFILP